MCLNSLTSCLCITQPERGKKYKCNHGCCHLFYTLLAEPFVLFCVSGVLLKSGLAHFKHDIIKTPYSINDIFYCQ